MTEEQLIYTLELQHVSKSGAITAKKLIAHCGSAEAVLNEKKSKLAIHQIKSSAGAKTTGRATQLTARNTALIYEQNIEMHNTQLEILEKMSTNNRLLAEQLEAERFKQIQKEKSYGVTNK